nr:protein kinase [Chloroflexaceae bacterium]
LAASSDTPDLSSLAEADSFTPYSAPEQRFDQNDAAPTLDVYSLGALIFHMVSGDVPPAPGAELPSLATRDPALTGVDQVLRRMLAAGPAARYPSAGAAVAALRQAMRFQLDHASADMEESRWEPVAEWLENPLEAALGDTLAGDFGEFLSNSRKRADDLHRHNVIRRLLNRWSRGGFFRKQNLGQLVQPEQIVSYNLYFYELRTIYETRTAPEPRLRPREADEHAALLPSPSVWDVQVPEDVRAAERTQELLLPNSARVLTCTSCGGEGKVPCKQCHGQGTIERTQTTRDAEGTTRKESLTETCPTCQGYGTQPCPTCKGSGEVIEEQVFTWARNGRQWNNTDDLEDLPVRRVEAAARPVFSGSVNVYEGRWHSVAPLAELLRSAIDHVGDDTRLVEAELRINGSQVTEMDYQLNEKEHHLFIIGEENVLVGDRSLLNIERISIVVLLVLTVLLAIGWLLLVR